MSKVAAKTTKRPPAAAPVPPSNMRISGARLGAACGPHEVPMPAVVLENIIDLVEEARKMMFSAAGYFVLAEAASRRDDASPEPDLSCRFNDAMNDLAMALSAVETEVQWGADGRGRACDGALLRAVQE